MSRDAPPRRAATVFESGGVEFGRVLAFSDGLFSIAMTLLVVAITVPILAAVNDGRELLRALHELVPDFVGFFLGFAVIGRYWVAHHQMFSFLLGVDYPLITRNLVYLAFVAFLPFPTALLGDYFGNPVAVSAFAITAAIVSAMEVVLLRYAYRAGLLRLRLSARALRWGTAQSVAPVVFFLFSVPIAFVNTAVAVATWFLTIPFGMYMDRHRPEGAEALEG